MRPRMAGFLRVPTCLAETSLARCHAWQVASARNSRPALARRALEVAISSPICPPARMQPDLWTKYDGTCPHHCVSPQLHRRARRMRHARDCTAKPHPRPALQRMCGPGIHRPAMANGLPVCGMRGAWGCVPFHACAPLPPSPNP